jgi:hypothetical protein
MPQREQFIYIPLPWFIAAARLPGKASVVGSLLWYRAKIRQTPTVTLSTELVRQAGITPPTIRHALHLLEKAGLLRVVERLPGRKPVVTLIEPEFVETRDPVVLAQMGDDDYDDLSPYLPPDLPPLPPREENPFAHFRIMRARNAALIEAEAQRDCDRRERKRRARKKRSAPATLKAE